MRTAGGAVARYRQAPEVRPLGPRAARPLCFGGRRLVVAA